MNPPTTTNEVVLANRRGQGQALGNVLTKVVDVAIFVLLVFAPLVMAGRYPIGRLVYVSLIGIAATAWMLRLALSRGAQLRRTGGEWILGLAVAISLLQLVPLPSSVLSSLSSQLSERLPLWAGSEEPFSLGTWNQISLAPAATLNGLGMLIALGALFLIVCQRLKDTDDVARLLAIIIVSVVVMAVVGIVHYLTSNGRFLWVYEHPMRRASGSATGTFYNHNHFAHFLALGAGPLVWWIVTALRDKQPQQGGFEARKSTATPSSMDRIRQFCREPLLIVPLCGIVLLAAMLSMSRGGMLALGVATGTATVLLFALRQLQWRMAIGLVGAMVLVGAALSIHGLDYVRAQVDDLTSGSIEKMDEQGVRRAVWSANLEAIEDHWVLGAGVGVHRHLIPAYLQKDHGVEFTHSESGYLQIVLETGVIGCVLLLASIGLAGYWGYSALRHAPTSRHAALAAAVVAGIVASLVHSIWDFVWYIPATMVPTLMLLACLCRLHQMATADGEATASSTPTTWAQNLLRGSCIPLGPNTAWAGVLLTAFVAAWMISNAAPSALASPAWDRYLRSAVLVQQSEEAELNLADESRTPEERLEEGIARLDAILEHLRQVVAVNPSDARAHLRLAGRYMQRFELAMQGSENQMPIGQIRDAAVASGFTSREQLDEWLTRAVGPPRTLLNAALFHARRGLTLSPYSGEGYLYMSNLCFLDGGDKQTTAIYLDQARRVRPHDGDILIQSGVEAWLEMNVEKAIAWWQEAYNSGTSYQYKLASILANDMPATWFLEWFKPNLEVMRRLHYQYTKRNLDHQLQALLPYYSQIASLAAKEATDQQAGELWYLAFRLQKEMNAHQRAKNSLREALQCEPNNIWIRLAAGRYFLEHEDFPAAEEHLRWCLDRRPHDRTIARDVQAAQLGRLRVSSSSPLQR